MGKSKKKVKTPPSAKGKKSKEKKPVVTLDEIEAMSDSDEGSLDDKNKSGNAKAEALKKLISTGAFDELLNQDNEKDDESVEEIELGDNEDNDDDDDDESSEGDKPVKESKSEDDEEENTTEEKEGDENSADGSESNNDKEEEDERTQLDALYDPNSKAVRAKIEELQAERKNVPWSETFDIISSTPLPFGTIDEETGTKIDVHDDLKREVAFYNVALDAVEEARMKCKSSNIPFTRPEDFFAEMVKSDDHMARIKDRLIFENKKIDAVTQRKSNKEQKLRAKESHANKIAEKSKRKKDNMKQVDDWAQSAASNRGGRYEDNADDKYIKKLQGGQKRPWTDRDGSLQTGPNKKRMNADRKYGYGGKTGRFKQNSKAELDDMSKFNPRGSRGAGQKKGGGGGAGRQGKRARDAGRSRQRS